MKVLIVNPIMYTSESKKIKRAETIKDTMIYDLCLAFLEKGHTVTLATCDDYRPCREESYPFEVLWMKAKLKRLCPVNAIPFCPEVVKIASKGKFDLIISSEVLSLNSLMLALTANKRLIIWHELARHHKIMKRIPSRIWHGVVARIFFRKTLVVPRSVEAKRFISAYCKNVSDIIIDHGVNLDQFELCTEKTNTFAVSARLSVLKRIDKIIMAFKAFCDKYDNSYKLIIMGDGDARQSLEALTSELGLSDNVIFTGRLRHDELVSHLKLAKAMLIYTVKDNNMLSVVESIAVGTPIITNTVPFNATYIRENSLGIVSDCWNEDDLYEVATNHSYVDACVDYRSTLSTLYKVEQFEKARKSLK